MCETREYIKYTVNLQQDISVPSPNSALRMPRVATMVGQNVLVVKIRSTAGNKTKSFSATRPATTNDGAVL